MQNKPVKLTLPGLARVYPRNRLFKKLDELNPFPLIWVAAPGGAGKTTLVASYLQSKNITPLWFQIDQSDKDMASFFYYLGEGLKRLNHSRKRVLPLLTPECLLDVPTFSRNFFRKLFSNMKAPGVLVLDNFECVTSDATFNEILQQGLEEIPEGCQVIITGRTLPPAQYTKMIAKQLLAQIGWDELQLSAEESTGITSLLAGKEVYPEKVLSLFYKATHGWVSGLVLFNQFFKSNDMPDVEAMAAGKTNDSFSQQVFFDYFVSEAFNHLPGDTQIFLLKTAHLSDMKVSTTKQLTGIGSAKKILNDLNQKQLFTARRGLLKPVYTYHPLFKDFLQSQAQVFFTSQELNDIKNMAAQILLDTKDIEAAASLLIHLHNWPVLESLIKRHAKSLSEQGRFKLLQDWFNQLPLSHFEQSPWMLYWRGNTELMFEPLNARQDFERAHHLFKTGNNARGIYLSWLGVMESILYCNDTCEDVPKWMQELELIRKKYHHYPSLEIKGRVTFTAFILLLMACPESDLFKEWLHKAERLHRLIPIASVRCLTGSQLAMYYVFYSKTTKLKMLSKSLIKPARSEKTIPIARLMAYWVEIKCGWVSGETAETEAVIEAALQVSKESGVYVVQLWLLSAAVTFYLVKQNIPAAEKYLDHLQQYVQHNHRAKQVHYHYLMGWLAYLKQDLQLAHEHTETACKIIADLHLPFLELLSWCVHCFVLIGLKRYEEAKKLIIQSRQRANELKSGNMGVYYLGMLEAWMAHKQHQVEDVLQPLREAFAYAREAELVAVPWHVPGMLAPLCALALRNNIEVDYVRTFIRKNSLEMPTEAMLLSDWPMPIRISTLGHFSLSINDQVICQQNNGFNKPCELLCAIIAFGGQEVSGSKLEDALWPEAAGDAAHRALITNLQRLRQLLGISEAIQYTGGKLTLDARYCWVDAWAFEQGLDTGIPEQCMQSLMLYQNNFLHSEDNISWCLSTREHLRRKYLLQLEKHGEALACKGKWHDSITWYHRGLQIDELYETYYQGLMRAHQQLGQTSELIGVYQQCQQKMLAELGVKPSPKTTALFESLSS